MCPDANKKPERASSLPILPLDTARDEVSATVQTVQQIEELSERMAALTNTNRQLKRKIFDLYTIFEISRNFNSVLDYETLLDTFILTALAQVGADLLDPGDRHLGDAPGPHTTGLHRQLTHTWQ